MINAEAAETNRAEIAEKIEKGSMRSAGKLSMRPCEFIQFLGRVFSRGRTRSAWLMNFGNGACVSKHSSRYL